MADIENNAVFTNAVVSSGTSDLLQQALQQVVDEHDEQQQQESEFVTFLHTDGDEPQTIHLTAAQAAALGLNFELSAGDEVPDEVPYQKSDASNGALSEKIQDQGDRSFATDNESLISDPGVKVEKKATTIRCFPSLEKEGEWSIEKCSDQDTQLLGTETHLQARLFDDPPNVISSQAQTISAFASNRSDSVSKLEVQPNCGIIPTAATLPRYNEPLKPLDTIQKSQARILQKLPVILPSSQFIVKPTLLKQTKNVRILPGNRISSNVGTFTNISSPNQSVLLPKSTIVGSLTPQVITATPITTQLLNSTDLSAQLLNTQILGPCEITGATVNGTKVLIDTSNSGLVNSQVTLSPLLKPTTIQRGQFVKPVLKNCFSVKQPQILTSVKKQSTGLKSVQIPAQLLRTVASTTTTTTTATGIVKNGATNSKLGSINSSPIIFGVEKDTKSNGNPILKPIQISSSPVSILKPQGKSLIHNGQNNRTNLLVNNQNRVVESSRKEDHELSNGTKLHNGTKQKSFIHNSGVSLSDGSSKRLKSGVDSLIKPNSINTDRSSNVKPLGSSENPIQIIQQGQTFHSMQRLTQSQLKQIAHVLQQRSQEANVQNEKIVYRVVFPEELDLRIRNPENILKNRGAKRGRPKKNAFKSPIIPSKAPVVPEEDQEESKDDRKKVVARTRSGRLSRPPRHMVRDYKHLHHLDFLQPDLDDSDGGYSDYNTNSDKLEDDESPKELLTGLEVPKRKISDHFRCPTCNKIYLGRTRMARHFEMHPDHGNVDQLPPATSELTELKQGQSANASSNTSTTSNTTLQDPLKRKGKKRGPWAYVTPEAKSERRQMKLREAISVCENVEIIKIAAKPVLDAQSIFDLLILKSGNKVQNLLSELKDLTSRVREKASSILKPAIITNQEQKIQEDRLLHLEDLTLCTILGLDPGVYKIHDNGLSQTGELLSSGGSSESLSSSSSSSCEEPPSKLQKKDDADEGKENIDEKRLSRSSLISESSDLSDLLMHDRRNESCPEVLSALTLMPRNPSPAETMDGGSKSISKLLISDPHIQHQISDSNGFQKVNINISKDNNLAFGDKLASSNFEESKHSLERAFIKLEPMELENFGKLQNGGFNLDNSQQHFVKLVSKDLHLVKLDSDSTSRGALTNSLCKIDGLPILQDSNGPIIGSTCDNSIFGNGENLDIGKITSYDHITTHLDILNSAGVTIDEKLVEQLHLDQTNLVDELVSERLKNIMPDNILESNLMSTHSNLDAELDFEALSEEFNRNTRS